MRFRIIPHNLTTFQVLEPLIQSLVTFFRIHSSMIDAMEISIFERAHTTAL
ncbi:hypothetical protein SCG7109_AV_00060 [Chlamydiales bacterium SCGC AG-110-M15]|nr:hypothetical protein SCG7109_AV_00060 [Chlamydiales bacterium SCGC AG-110-M15]